jgi:hypothetical protein
MTRAKNSERREVKSGMRLRPTALARTHHCAAATRFGGRFARVEVTSMAEADLRSRPEARVILEARACAIGVNAESAK